MDRAAGSTHRTDLPCKQADLGALAMTAAPAACARADGSLPAGLPGLSFGALAAGSSPPSIITPIPREGQPAAERGTAAKRITAGSLERARRLAEEEHLKLEPRKAEATCLAFFSATDRTVQGARPGAYRRMTPVTAAVGHLVASFNMLYTDPDPPARERAPAMLQAARHAGGPEDPTAPVGAAVRLYPPGRNGFQVTDSTGLRGSTPVIERRGGIAFDATSAGGARTLTVLIEPPDRRGDGAADYRSGYRKHALRRRRIGSGLRTRYPDTREWDDDGKAVLRNAAVVGPEGGSVSRAEGMTGFKVHDGPWMDAHLPSNDEDTNMIEAWSETFRKSLRIGED